MRNTKIRFKYCTEENIDINVKLPKDITMADIIEVLGDEEATISNIEEAIELLDGIIFDVEEGDINEMFSIVEINKNSYN
ncbi:MAG: hypothetical protein ACI31M_00965 [Bacilli bacterium]